MPFWGIEVKPWKSYAYSSDSASRKLRITQASIGPGKSNARSTLQINVGYKKPIILCNLLPNVFENFNMELELEESEDVIFSVLGERSVHLAGYLIDGPDCKLNGNDFDSIGEDIVHTESSGSYGDCSDLDKYESDFIDDDDEITNSPSPRSTSKERKETSCWNASYRRLKKAYQVSDSDDCKYQLVTKSNSIFNVESDDTDDSLLLFFQKKKNEKKKSSVDVSLNTDNPRVVGGLKEMVHVSDSSPSKETMIAQESSEKTRKKKKKNKRSNEEKGIVVSPSVVEDHVEPDKNAHDETGTRNKENKQKETGEKDETGVEGSQHLGAVPDKNGHDETRKRKKGRKQKETSEVDSSDKIDDNPLAIYSDNDGGGKKKRETKKQEETVAKVDENPRSSNAAAHSEVSVVPSDTTGQTAKLGNKKSKKRTKDERRCDSEVADVDSSDAKKLKKENSGNDDIK